MAIRRVITVFVGHVDHGKTSLQDRIRQTAVAAGEAGAITQKISASAISIAAIKKICGPLFSALKDVTIPGILAIDTPGHAAFTNLRKRGGSLADIAVLVVDINEGFKLQTLEALEILKANKVPFVVAANKIDLVTGWRYQPGKYLTENVKALPPRAVEEFEKKLYELVGQLHEQGFRSERFDRVTDYTKEIAIVPTSAATGQGIPELLLVVTGLAQRFLEKRLETEVEGYAKGTILEVKEERGLGKTIDVVIYSGTLKVNDIIVVGTVTEPIVTKVRALLEPGEKPDTFKPVKEIAAAISVKISAPGLESAFAGMPVRSCDIRESEQVKEEITQEIRGIMIDTEGEGLVVKADALGSLEALVHLLKEKNIPVISASIGNITKQDIAKAGSVAEKDRTFSAILGFNVAVPPDVEEAARGKRITLITGEVIYTLLEEYLAFVERVKKEAEVNVVNTLVRPAKFQILRGYVFRQSNPAIVGVVVEMGTIATGMPVMNAEGKNISAINEIRQGKENLSSLEQGKEAAVSLNGVTMGRQLKEGDILYSDVPEQDFKQFKVLKKYLSTGEISLLKEIAEIKRKDNPVWGLG